MSDQSWDSFKSSFNHKSRVLELLILKYKAKLYRLEAEKMRKRLQTDSKFDDELPRLVNDNQQS